MASIADLEVEQVKQHLIAGGFLGAFTDIYGDAQPALITQELEADFVSIANDDRIAMIRTVGGITNPANRTLYKERIMMVMVTGQVGEKDSVIVNGLANDMEEYLMANPSDGQCMFNIVSSGVTGPFINKDSRRSYEINFTASFNIVRPSFV